METLSISQIIKRLSTKKIPLFSLNELEGILQIDNRQTLYKRIARLARNDILQKLIKGKYYFTLNDVNDFTLSNFLYQPSYISMQSALSFHNIITGFSYQITSITIKKSKNIVINQKDFSYSKIDTNLFWGWEKRQDFLIARPEKALLDYVYFATKGLVNLDWDEIDMTNLDRKLLLEWGRKYDKIVLREVKKCI